METLRAELDAAGADINVMLVCPSFVKTSISENALSGSGEAHGRPDIEIQSGMSPEYLVDEILAAIFERRKELIVGPMLHKAGIIIRHLCPSLFFYAMKRRALNVLRKRKAE